MGRVRKVFGSLSGDIGGKLGDIASCAGAKAVCGRGASVQAINVNQIAQVPNPASRPTTLIGRPPNCNTFYITSIIMSSTGIGSLASQKKPR